MIGTTNVTLVGGGQVTLDGYTANLITGANASATLINQDNTISGGGQLGGGTLTLVNQANGVIENGGGDLTIDTGATTIGNAGLLEAVSGGALTIGSAVSNTGTILANGVLRIAGSVNGSGAVDIDVGGTLSVGGGITNGTVTFKRGTSSGTLSLGTPRWRYGCDPGLRGGGRNRPGRSCRDIAQLLWHDYQRHADSQRD